MPIECPRVGWVRSTRGCVRARKPARVPNRCGELAGEWLGYGDCAASDSLPTEQRSSLAGRRCGSCACAGEGPTSRMVPCAGGFDWVLSAIRGLRSSPYEGIGGRARGLAVRIVPWAGRLRELDGSARRVHGDRLRPDSAPRSRCLPHLGGEAGLGKAPARSVCDSGSPVPRDRAREQLLKCRGRRLRRRHRGLRQTDDLSSSTPATRRSICRRSSTSCRRSRSSSRRDRSC